MGYLNLFQVLGITDPNQYSRETVEAAWLDLKIAAGNAESVVHQSQQDAYTYLTGNDPDARQLLEVLGEESLEPANLVLHRELVNRADFAEPFPIPNAELATVIVQHAELGGLNVFRHESDPYLYALAIPGSAGPGEGFVLDTQAGAPLKNGQPRWGFSTSSTQPALGPRSFADHCRELLIDILLFRWLRTGRVASKFQKIALLVTVIALVWGAVELFDVRSRVWRLRGLGDEVIDNSDSAAERLRHARSKLRDVERKGEQVLGWDAWWEEKPPSGFALSLMQGSERKKEAYKKLRVDTREVRRRIDRLTASIDAVAEDSANAASRAEIYVAERTTDEVNSLLEDMETLEHDIAKFSEL